MGQSRSVTIIQSYLISRENMSLLDVCHIFEEKAILTKLNAGFQKQLMQFEKDLTNKSTKDFFNLGTRIRRSPIFFSSEVPAPRSNRRTPRSTHKTPSTKEKLSAVETPYKSATAVRVPLGVLENNSSKTKTPKGKLLKTPAKVEIKKELVPEFVLHLSPSSSTSNSPEKSNSSGIEDLEFEEPTGDIVY